jgi:L-ribulokinase
MARYALGLDYGTESVRALIVDCDGGGEAAVAVKAYEHGVISQSLPGSRDALPLDFALQHPQDYIDAGLAVIADVLKTIPAKDIIGIGVDFTACTMLPILKDGTPLMQLERFRNNPHAWVKLWKHHAAQGEADAIAELARKRNEAFLKYYGGVISSEWMLPKCWEIARRAPEIYQAADFFIDAGDWVVQQLTGSFCRNACAAGYKGFWNAELGFPSRAFLKELAPEIAGVADKWLQNIVAPGRPAGSVSAAFAAKSGLKAGTPVSAATIDAHSGVPGMRVCRAGAASIIMGTSSCHMFLSRELKFFEGYAGVTKDGIIPGFYGYESGQSAVGDIFGWFAKNFSGVTKSDPFEALSRDAAKLRAGESGLIALDWMNGNRSVLMDARLSGAIVGLTLDSTPAEIYRALIEGTAFGTKVILDAYVGAGIPVNEIVVCGGLTKDPLIVQIYADVMNLPVEVAASSQAVALGSCMLGALAAGPERGGFATMEDAIAKMTRPAERTYKPDAKSAAIYRELFKFYKKSHDMFGRDHAAVMRELKELKVKMRTGGN